MRIEAFGALVAVVWLTAVLCMRLVAANNQTLNFSSRKSREANYLEEGQSHWTTMLPEDSMPRHPKMHMKDLVRYLALNETGNMSAYIDCCPTDEEMTEPVGGRNRDGMFVELYRDGENVQRFYEYSCKPGVENKPCRFADYRIKAQSRCVQKYSYSYAIVQNPEYKEHHRHHRGQAQFPAFAGSGGSSSSSWTLDYIKLRSGCGCEVKSEPKEKKPGKKPKKPASMKKKGPRSSRAHSGLFESSSQLGSEQQSSQQDSSTEV